jgi:hypothetical protein
MELVDNLNAKGYQGSFSVGQRIPDRNLLLCENGLWKIVTIERGVEITHSTYDDESAACQAFFELVTLTSPGIPAEEYFDKAGYPRNSSDLK